MTGINAPVGSFDGRVVRHDGDPDHPSPYLPTLFREVTCCRTYPVAVGYHIGRCGDCGTSPS